MLFKYLKFTLNDFIFLHSDLFSPILDDGTLYFDEKRIDAKDHMGPLFTSSYVVRGFTTYAAVASGKINVSSVIFFFKKTLVQIV